MPRQARMWWGCHSPTACSQLRSSHTPPAPWQTRCDTRSSSAPCTAGIQQAHHALSMGCVVSGARLPPPIHPAPPPWVATPPQCRHVRNSPARKSRSPPPARSPGHTLCTLPPSCCSTSSWAWYMRRSALWWGLVRSRFVSTRCTCPHPPGSWSTWCRCMARRQIRRLSHWCSRTHTGSTGSPPSTHCSWEDTGWGGGLHGCDVVVAVV